MSDRNLMRYNRLIYVSDDKQTKINLKRMSVYREIWKHFNLRYTIEQIGETIELIEETQNFPNISEASYEIWQKYLELK